MNRLAGFSIAAAAGAVIGGAVALLFAPQSGKETRKMLTSKVEETRQGVLNVAGDVKEFATNTADKVMWAAAETNRKGEAVVRAIKG